MAARPSFDWLKKIEEAGRRLPRVMRRFIFKSAVSRPDAGQKKRVMCTKIITSGMKTLAKLPMNVVCLPPNATAHQNEEGLLCANIYKRRARERNQSDDTPVPHRIPVRVLDDAGEAVREERVGRGGGRVSRADW